ncbi:MAG: winged helix-turn-helix transcriptional regulator [Acetobacteraceae bacterium]|jgi:DNA-binding MarR family transcriptional regulator|nr:winged helix-turn-helix transcriptional regulator [Acetobacteraceae bacterium]MBV8578125.1 winged helix-turn-helix transcriptional regulator [Acetobacteraceae bacterium]
MKSNARLAEVPEEGLDGFKLEEFLPYQLSVTANTVSRLFAKRYAEEYGLSIPEWRVLVVVGRFGTASPSMVSEWAAMDKVKVSRAAATLVARGLLKQTQDPADGRARLLRLTRKGVSVHQGAVPLAQEIEAQLANGLSRSEWSALQKSLTRLTAHVHELGVGEEGSEE